MGKKLLAELNRFLDANIFNNTYDAIFGSIVLFISPLASLILTRYSLIALDGANLGFPITAICAAGMYDAYGRLYDRYKHLENNIYRRIKLFSRIIVDTLVIVMIWLGIGLQSFTLISWALRGLTFSGILIFVNAIIMFKEGERKG